MNESTNTRKCVCLYYRGFYDGSGKDAVKTNLENGSGTVTVQKNSWKEERILHMQYGKPWWWIQPGLA